MSLVDASISSDVVLPPGYRIFNIGENIELVVGGKTEYRKIINVNWIPFISKQDNTNWLLSAAGKYNAGDISDWLEPYENELMVLAISMYCDRDAYVKIKIPSSDQLLGTKSDTDVAMTPTLSPWKQPRVLVYSWGTTYIPNFYIENPTEYKLFCLKIGVTGHRYETEKLKTKPEKYTTINLNLIRE